MENSKAILIETKKFEIQDVEIPVPAEDEVLLKVEYVGMCGSDIHGFEHGPYIPPSDPNTKIGLGHECSGEVIEIGSNVNDLNIGDKVAIEPGVPCRKCKFCMEGKYNICPSVDFMATSPNYKGALTHYLTHPADLTFKLPDNMDTMEGALIEPLAVGFHAATQGGAGVGDKVVILGAGSIGLMTLQACKTMGVSEIVVIDLFDNKLEFAKSLGATEVIKANIPDMLNECKKLLGPYGADIVFETAGSQVTASQTTSLISRGGTIIIVGTIPGETPINFLSINREVTIKTVFRYANMFPSAIEAVAAGKINVKGSVNKLFDYKDVQEAFDYSIRNKQELIKGVIKVS
ncbi:NAD(P)-dependent alcohol dehydrogenase [Alteribacillus sp. YIM 98480]|uniref:NAD(P)-dependent alcohol dehydrogenase n=1 Tax=Alteribacillus sp. YIM 98480 TaxID=2606599 RepID=UPI00131D3FD0|nr:NAD(P)-dependent alcohol dehydrogenase [Alteribacillus sp. YIM 98480]